MKFVTVRSAAKELGLPEGSIRRAVRQGTLQSLKLGNRVVVDLEQVARLERPAGVDINEVSEKTGLTTCAIYRACREGWIPYARSGKKFVFDLDAVYRAIEARMEQQSEK